MTQHDILTQNLTDYSRVIVGLRGMQSKKVCALLERGGVISASVVTIEMLDGSRAIVDKFGRVVWDSE